MPGRPSTPLVTVALLLAALALPGPVRGGSIVEEVVSFPGHDGVTLTGIVSRPKSPKGSTPAILILPGSGGADADGTFDVPLLESSNGQQKIYRAVARYLSRRGNVVLRYNKRGLSFGRENDDLEIASRAVFRDLVGDAGSALDFLESRPGVDPGRLAIWGHSQGSQIAQLLDRSRGDLELLILVGSAAGSLEDLLRFQLVEPYVDFLRRAADADGNGVVSLEELNRIDGRLGASSAWILGRAELLFGVTPGTDGTIEASAFSAEVDLDGDGRLDIDSELIPALEAEAEAEVSRWRSGAMGALAASWMREKPPLKNIQKTGAELLFVVGQLDVQTPVSETRALVDKLERRKRDNWQLLILSDLGHNLSKPNDSFAEDAGLTTLDNPTVNEPSKKTLRKIWKRARKQLRSGGNPRSSGP